MNPLEKFFTEAPGWHEKIGAIHTLLERVKISEEQSSDVLHLRWLNRILSVRASTAIEGNQLSLGQVTDVVIGKTNPRPCRATAAVGQTSEAHPLIKSSAVH
jgi:Fic family protein